MLGFGFPERYQTPSRQVRRTESSGGGIVAENRHCTPNHGGASFHPLRLARSCGLPPESYSALLAIAHRTLIFAVFVHVDRPLAGGPSFQPRQTLGGPSFASFVRVGFAAVSPIALAAKQQSEPSSPPQTTDWGLVVPRAEPSLSVITNSDPVTFRHLKSEKFSSD